METAHPVAWLTAGRLAGLGGALFIPIVLARVFDPSDFGAYRQIFLVYGTLYAVAQAGLAESLYYFVPRDGARAGRYAANSALGLGALGIACAAMLAGFSGALAAWLGNAALAGLLPWLGAFLAPMLVSAALEAVLVSRGRHRAAAVSYFASDLARAGFLVAPALAFGSVRGLLAGAVAFAALRLFATAGVLVADFRSGLRPSAPLIRSQLAWALPFAAAVVIDTFVAHLHFYVVSSRFDPATFALYSVACFQIPLVDYVATAAGNVLMVRVGRRTADGGGAIAAWRDTIARLAFVFFPLVALLVVCGPTLVVFLFGRPYAAAGSLFVLASSGVLLGALPTDAMLRACGDTRGLLGIGALRFAIVATALGPLIGAWSLAGAVAGTLAGAAVAKAVAVARVRRHLGVRAARLVPWRPVAAIAAAAAVAALPAAVVARAAAAWSPFARLAAAGTVFAVAYAAAVWRLGLLAALLERRSAPDRTQPCAGSPESSNWMPGPT